MLGAWAPILSLGAWGEILPRYATSVRGWSQSFLPAGGGMSMWPQIFFWFTTLGGGDLGLLGRKPTKNLLAKSILCY